MEGSRLNWIANFIWGIADDVLRDLYVRGKYRDVILPMTVGDVPAAVEFGRVAAAPVNTLRQQPHRCQEISVCF